MSSNEFWNDDPDLFWAYRFSYYKKTQKEFDESNFRTWLQGMYFYEAVSVALANSFGKQHLNYSDKPYEFNKKLSEEEERANAVAELKARVSQVQEIFKKGQEQEIIGGEKR